MAKKVVYTVEREFLKKYDTKKTVELIIAQYIKNGREGEIPNRPVTNSAINQSYRNSQDLAME